VTARERTVSVEQSRQDLLRPVDACLFLLTDCEQPRAGSSRHFLAGVDEVLIGRGDARGFTRSIDGRKLRIRVADVRTSSRHARLIRGARGFEIEDLGSKNGTLVNGQKRQQVALTDGDVIECGYTFFIYRDQFSSPETVDFATGDIADGSGKLTSMIPEIAAQLEQLSAVARSDLAVLVLGESGTGKELIARAVHASSQREGSFVPVNCGAIAESLIDSELFGYKKGAFSGASEERSGLVRAAHRGTLFLDEVGELSTKAQTALLRVLQEREVLPVGASRAVPADIRLVAATNRDLEDLSDEKLFRVDLLARMKGFTLRLRPLRERREDLGLILGALSQRIARKHGRTDLAFTAEAMRTIIEYDWLLNVRELEQAIAAAAAISPERVQFRHLPENVRAFDATRARAARRARGGARRDLSPEEQSRRDELIALFQEHRGNVSEVARQLGKDRVQIHRWMKLYGLDPERFRK